MPSFLQMVSVVMDTVVPSIQHRRQLAFAMERLEVLEGELNDIKNKEVGTPCIP